MDSLFTGFPVQIIDDDLPENNFSALMNAISNKSYSLIYRLLHKFDYTFSPRAAFLLLNEALENGLTLKVFQAVLERCPPVPEILPAGVSSDPFLSSCGPVEKAAGADRADVLALLLERGASPNQMPNRDGSPLEAALTSQSLKCVELLMAQPELDTSWTPMLLFDWARAGHGGTLLDFCLQAMAPRFIGWEPATLESLPIPEPMTAPLIAGVGNWNLLERFCRERGSVPLDDGRQVLDDVHFSSVEEGEEKACAAALNALLERCPGLLRRQRDCRVLLRCFLRFGGEAREFLRPWVKRLQHKRISMEREDWICWEYDGLPELWQSLMPTGPTLLIDRWSDVLENFCFDEPGNDGPIRKSRALRRILSRCPVRGKGRAGKVSPVARAVLNCGAPELLSELLAPGGLLTEEDPGALMEYVQTAECPRASRGAVLAHVKKEENYEL